MAIKQTAALEVWTDVQCNGGVRLSLFTSPWRAEGWVTLGGRERATFGVDPAEAAFTDVIEGRVVRNAFRDGDFDEWRIVSVEDAIDDNGDYRATIECEGIRFDLRRRSGLLARTEAGGFVDLDWQLNGLSADDWADEFLGAPDIPSYIVKGTIGAANNVTVPVDGDDPLTGFEKLADLAELEFDLRRNGTTDYRADLLNERGSSAAKVLIASRRQLKTIAHVSDILDTGTRVYPRSGGSEGFRGTLAEHRWSVASVNVNDVTLSGGPIAFDDQLNDLWMEEPDGTTRNQVTDSVASTDVVTVPGHTVSPGDEVVFRLNAAGDDLTYLERPTEVASIGPIVQVLDRSDIPRVDNLITDPFLADWTGSTLNQYTVTGLTVTQNTTLKQYIHNGTSSALLQSDQAGQTITQDITVAPSLKEPFYTAQIGLTILSGEWKVRVDDVTNGGTYPADSSNFARSAQADRYLEFRIQPGVDFKTISTTTLRIRLESVQPGSCHLDAVQLVNRRTPADQFYDGRSANALWAAANAFLAEKGVAVQRYDIELDDLHRISTTDFANDELVLGGTVIAKADRMGIDLETRISELRPDWLNPARTRVVLSESLRDFTGLLGRRGPSRLQSLTGGSAAVDPSAADSGAISADDVTYTGDPAAPTVGSLQPAQTGADVTGQNTAANVVAVGSRIAVDVADATNRALTGLQNTGHLANILKLDGTNNLVIVSGKQGGFAADGDSVTFSPAFQDVPLVFFRPAGVFWPSALSGGTIAENWDGAAVTVSDTSGTTKTSEHTLAASSADGFYTLDFTVAQSADLHGSNAGLDLQVDPDGVSGYTTVKTWEFHPTDSSSGEANSDQILPFNYTWNEADDTMSVTSSGKFRFQLREIRDAGMNYTVTVTPIRVRWFSAGPSGELFWKTVPNGLSASGFTLVAKVVEREITTAAESDAFGAGTITTEGSSLALGGSGLSANAFDNTYRTQYDGTLTVTAIDNSVNEDDLFPAGVLDAVGESKEVTLSAQTNNDQYDVKYDRTLAATANGNTPTSDTMTGTRTTVGTFAETNLSRNPSGSLTAYFDITQNTGQVEVAVESNDGGAGWVEKASQTYVGTTGLQFLSWSEATLDKNDDVRFRIKSGSGSFSVSAVKCDYNAHFLKIDITAVVEVDKGAGWVQKDSTLYSVTDEDGVQNTNSATGITKSFTDAGLDQGEKVRVRVSALTVTGSGTKTHEIDPDGVEYTSGSIGEATMTVKVAHDADDGGIGTWVEKSVDTHVVTDTTGSGTTLNLTNFLGESFTDSAIGSGDDIRIRLKEISTVGDVDSTSVSIDPDSVEYTSQSGTTTEHSQTPLAGDEIPWVAVAT